MNKKIKNILLFLLKLLIGVLILLFVIWKVNNSQGALWAKEHNGENLWLGMWKLILNSRIEFIILAVLANIIAMLQVAFRWHDLLTCHKKGIGIIPLFKTIQILFVSYLYNNVLPASVGMDTIRAAYSYPYIKNKSEVLSSLLADRLLGFVGMLLLGVISAPFYFSKAYGKIIFSVEAGSFLLLILFLWLLSHKKLEKIYIHNIKKIKLFSIGEKLAEFYLVLRSYADKPKTVIRVIFFSMMLQFFLTLCMFFLAKALNIQNISLGVLLGYLPIINIIAMFPTPGGIGPREASVVFLLGKVGISPAIALTLSLFFYIVALFVSFSGIIFMPFLKLKKSTDNKDISIKKNMKE